MLKCNFQEQEDFQGHIIVTDADGKLFDLPNIGYKTFLKKDETLNCFCT